MYTVALADLLTALAAISLASAAIGAALEYLGHSIHHNHRKGRRR